MWFDDLTKYINVLLEMNRHNFTVGVGIMY